MKVTEATSKPHGEEERAGQTRREVGEGLGVGLGGGGYKKKKRERRRGRKGEKYCQFSTVAGREIQSLLFG